ncbi:hypothetical protein L210DRAFT_2928543 [Boletus edulis BED1]|uniref:C2H2-type domain-containing protein n=1 Tax=Boletus edulis BED1 TaxID=1328754 RepID=A0AAD4C1V8_BOLED|nr:hypothetical protein L210DRAFT_2928543 [Boletus edulis BED1]
MSGLFKCGEPCNRSFADSRGLSHHRNSCSIYIQRQSENRLKASQTSGSKRKSLHRLLPDSKRARNLPILTTADQPTSVGEAHLSAPEKGPDVLPGSTNIKRPSRYVRFQRRMLQRIVHAHLEHAVSHSVFVMNSQ